MNTWTHEDRAELERLIARKKAFYDEHRTPLRELTGRIMLKAVGSNVTSQRIDDLALELELHADELRDLLKPFDSGQRPPTIAAFVRAYSATDPRQSI